MIVPGSRPLSQTSLSLYDRRFLFVTGKGGVGKTTVTSALGLLLAASGKRVLCAACNAKERFSTIFSTAPLTNEPTELAPNFWGINMDPAKCMEEYGLMILRSRTLYRAVFDNRYARSFLRATPGLYEWAMLGKAWWHTTEDAKKQGKSYDIVLVDAPATGHGIDMLRVPNVIVEAAPPGILRRDAERAWSMFQDPAQAGVVVVTLAEEMPVNETQELLHVLNDELHLPVACVIANALWPTLFSPQEQEALLALPPPTNPTDPAAMAISAGARRAARERLQDQAWQRLRASVGDAPLFSLPHLLEETAFEPTIRRLSESFPRLLWLHEKDALLAASAKKNAK